MSQFLSLWLQNQAVYYRFILDLARYEVPFCFTAGFEAVGNQSPLRRVRWLFAPAFTCHVAVLT